MRRRVRHSMGGAAEAVMTWLRSCAIRSWLARRQPSSADFTPRRASFRDLASCANVAAVSSASALHRTAVALAYRAASRAHSEHPGTGIKGVLPTIARHSRGQRPFGDSFYKEVNSGFAQHRVFKGIHGPVKTRRWPPPEAVHFLLTADSPSERNKAGRHVRK